VKMCTPVEQASVSLGRHVLNDSCVVWCKPSPVTAHLVSRFVGFVLYCLLVNRSCSLRNAPFAVMFISSDVVSATYVT